MPKILENLARKLRARGEKDPLGMAYGILNKEGLMHGNKLTAKGRKKNKSEK